MKTFAGVAQRYEKAMLCATCLRNVNHCTFKMTFSILIVSSSDPQDRQPNLSLMNLPGWRIHSKSMHGYPWKSMDIQMDINSEKRIQQKMTFFLKQGVPIVFFSQFLAHFFVISLRFGDWI